jgi:hypothetical protein
LGKSIFIWLMLWLRGIGDCSRYWESLDLMKCIFSVVGFVPTGVRWLEFGEALAGTGGVGCPVDGWWGCGDWEGSGGGPGWGFMASNAANLLDKQYH